MSCSAYYLNKDFSGAISECTRVHELHHEPIVLYWRGQSHESLGNAAAAVADLERVAASRSWKRTTAAIAVSVILGNEKQYERMLRVFERWPYLFDERTQRKGDLAVAYNNRCFAHMRLGSLEDALADCTESLRHGSLPDAFAKQQTLIKRLEEKAREI